MCFLNQRGSYGGGDRRRLQKAEPLLETPSLMIAPAPWPLRDRQRRLHLQAPGPRLPQSGHRGHHPPRELAARDAGHTRNTRLFLRTRNPPSPNMECLPPVHYPCTNPGFWNTAAGSRDLPARTVDFGKHFGKRGGILESCLLVYMKCKKKEKNPFL